MERKKTPRSHRINDAVRSRVFIAFDARVACAFVRGHNGKYQDDDAENTMVREKDDTRGEPSGAASHSYCSKDTSKISAEAKSSFIRKRNFDDFGMEKKRVRDPG